MNTYDRPCHVTRIAHSITQYARTERKELSKIQHTCVKESKSFHYSNFVNIISEKFEFLYLSLGFTFFRCLGSNSKDFSGLPKLTMYRL